MSVLSNDIFFFLDRAVSQKEVSCIVAQNQEEFVDFQNTLHTVGFRKVSDATEALLAVAESGKIYFSLQEEKQGGEGAKDIYDFIVQYPTGSVELWDTVEKKSLIASPSYSGSAVVFLVTEDELLALREKGFEVLDKVGLTYRNTTSS